MTATKVKIVIASLDPEVQAVWATLRDDGISSQLATCYEEAAELLAASTHSLLVMDSGLPEEDLRAVHDQLHAAATPVLLVLGPEASPGALAFCNSRIEERIAKPVSGSELALRIKALALRAELVIEPAPKAVNAVHPMQPEQMGQLIAIYGTKGGAGKSTIAVNLAVCLATTFRRKVLVADTDLWYGDIGVLLDAHSDKSLSDICSSSNDVDLFGLPKAVVPHPLGPSLLLRPADPRAVEKLSPALIGKTLATYCALYDYVVADTSPTLDDVNLHILDAADRILLVTTPELTSIHNCVRFLAVAETLGYSDKVELVINRADIGVEVAQIETTMRLKIFARIINDWNLVSQAANEGTSIYTLDPHENAQITRDLTTLTELVVGHTRPAALVLPRPTTPVRFWQRFPLLRTA